MVDGYELVESRTSVAAFHGRALPAERRVWHHIVSDHALVLGSSQSLADVDLDAAAGADVEVVRRRSGGGAVLLTPGEVTWIDVVVLRHGTGWSDDVHGPMRWLGEHLASLFGERLPERSVTAHVGAMRSTAWSRVVCFDGVGTGEVLVDGVKLVGMSQRRTRDVARLQCCWHHRYDPADLIALLAPTARPHLGDLGPVATIPVDLSAGIPGALAARL